MRLSRRSRRLHGRRGLKFDVDFLQDGQYCRRLHGRRGLKFVTKSGMRMSLMVAAFTGGVD